MDAYDILPKLFSFGIYFLGLFIAYKVWDDFEYYKYLKKKIGDTSGVEKSGSYPLSLQSFGLIGSLACQVMKI